MNRTEYLGRRIVITGRLPNRMLEYRPCKTGPRDLVSLSRRISEVDMAYSSMSLFLTYSSIEKMS